MSFLVTISVCDIMTVTRVVRKSAESRGKKRIAKLLLERHREKAQIKPKTPGLRRFFAQNAGTFTHHDPT